MLSALRALLTAACLLFGSLLVLAGAMAAQERAQTLRWPAHDAVVVSSVLRSSTSPGRRDWFPHIVVRLQGEDPPLRVAVAYGRWLGFGEQIRRSAEADVARYPQGRGVRVYRSPDDTRKAVLERPPWTTPLAVCALGLGLIAVPLVARRWRRRASRV